MHAIDSTALVLVAVVPQPRDLEIARLLGWYRIPLRSAPKLLFVDFIAFYLPAAFGVAGGRIAYAAPVLGHELTTRRALLKDEPDHPSADQEYFKINLGPLISLVDPIPADSWKRFAFFYTTGEYLLQARSLNDLVIRSDERVEIWRAMRDRAAGSQVYRPTPAPAGDLQAVLDLLFRPD